MKQVLLLSLAMASVAFGQDTPLDVLWNVSAPALTVNAETGVHTISFAHGAGEERFELSLWTAACRTGAGTEVADPGTLGIDLRNRAGDTSSSSYDFSFNQAIVGDSTISALTTDSNQTQTVTVTFCAVFDNMAQGGMIVNFEQLMITMTIVIDGSFTVQDFNAQVRDPAIDNEGSLQYGVTARICNVPETTTVFNQGQVIEICICTPGAPAVRVAQVRSMQYAAGEVTQIATTAEGGQGFLSTIRPTYDESINDNLNSCMSVTTLPSQQFYQGATAIPVVVTGRAVLEFPGQTRTRHLRALRREEEQPFQMQLVLLSDGSGAPYWTVVLVPLVAAAGLVL